MPVPANVLNNIAAGSRDRVREGLERAAAKFERYFEFTLPLVRATPQAPGNAWTYSEQSMISDITILWSLYAECHEVIGGHVHVAPVVEHDNYLRGQLRRLVDGDGAGSFWHFPNGLIVDPVNNPIELPWLVRTLRNGYAHFRWGFENLSATDYWDRQGWERQQANPAFGLAARPANNYVAYIADSTARRWDSTAFWTLADLRILVTSYPSLRYRLHTFLNYLLHDRKRCIFGHDLSVEA